MKNKKGAVNTYRFIAMYVIIGMLIGMTTMFTQDTTTTTGAYDLNSEERISEVVSEGEDILEESETLVQANQFALSSSFGDEKALGRNWIEILRRGFLPTGFIPDDYNASEMEEGINWMLIFFRWIVMMFAGYEIFQIIIKPKTT